jgi:hypothetical protein
MWRQRLPRRSAIVQVVLRCVALVTEVGVLITLSYIVARYSKSSDPYETTAPPWHISFVAVSLVLGDSMLVYLTDH